MAAGAALPASAAPGATGDAAKGKLVFARCAMCHDVKPGAVKMGPPLNGLFGRTSGAVAGFAYSPAMQKAKIRWDAKTLDAFLTKPSGLVPGNRMAFAGVPAAADRANLIAYLAGATK
ncbi:cytochrome c family protein [Sphingobium sp. OAS761]|uniref:c-type cytochrome n=1 Tax=Sphingobium sp. OAS761 TaxID=2817901 RepID=UPI0020A0434C|nr:c-type cytochrome [Sphingobium sp. OAS761]